MEVKCPDFFIRIFLKAYVFNGHQELSCLSIYQMKHESF